MESIGLKYQEEQKEQYARRQAEKFGRLAKYSLDPENKSKYGARAKEWRRVRFRTGDLDSHSYAQSKRPLANFRATPQNQVVNILRQDSEEWIQNLTDEEKRAIQKYTYNSGDKKPSRFFERLNAMLRGDLPEDEKLRRYADTISSAIRKQKLKRDVIVYRGSNIDPTTGLDEGALFKAKQFYSTSVIEKHALSGKYKLVIYVKKNTNAAYIEPLSYFSKQRELLLDKDCVYRIISKRENIIELEVV